MNIFYTREARKLFKALSYRVPRSEKRMLDNQIRFYKKNGIWEKLDSLYFHDTSKNVNWMDPEKSAP